MRPLSRLAASAALVVLALSSPLGAATVSREHLSGNDDHSYFAAIAVGDDGVVHRAWRDGHGADPGAILKYARGGLGDWTEETVDTREATLRGDDIAVDAEGRVHLAYYWNNREDPDQPRLAVVHAVREADGWVHTTLANPDVLSGTALAVGPDGHPRVAWLSSLDPDAAQGHRDGPAVVATYDGSGWTTADLPASGTPWDLKVDPDGHAHVLVKGDREVTVDGETTIVSYARHLTDASGTWAEEELPESLPVARLAIARGGRVHIVGFTTDNTGAQELRHLVRGPDGWEVDTTLEDEGRQYMRDSLHLAAGPDEQVHILFCEQRQEVWDGESDRWLYSLDGGNWTKESIGTREDSAEFAAVAVGPDGILHVLCGGREASRIDYLRIGGPAFDVDPSDLRVIRRGDGVVVRGRVRIRNLEWRRSAERSLRFARAEREEFLPGDAQVGGERRVRPMRPGARRTIRVSVRVDDPTRDERLLLLLLRRGLPGAGADPETAGAVPLGE